MDASVHKEKEVDIESKQKRKSTARKPSMCYMQLRLPTNIKKSTHKLAKKAGLSSNTYIRVLLESAAEGKVVVRSEAVEVEKTA
jgi:predicted HicB family RNase H-like nuclease